jgi:hypothetical protein
MIILGTQVRDFWSVNAIGKLLIARVPYHNDDTIDPFWNDILKVRMPWHICRQNPTKLGTVV